jgi:methionine-gamma-lyase
LRFSSQTIREGQLPETVRSTQLPLYATSSFCFESLEEGIDTFEGRKQLHFYSRYGNPTVEAVADKIARLEAYGSGFEAHGVLVSSGMAAISTLCLATLKSGDKLLTQPDLYGGTTELFLKILGPMGVETLTADLQDLEAVDKLLAAEPRIRMLYFETPSNPTLRCLDIAALSDIARRHGRLSVVDNTFCTPYLQQPLLLGADAVIHSTTKYLNGHGNSTAGIIVGRSEDLIKGPVWQAMKLLGTNCSPFEAWLTNNGLKTLGLRMDKHSANAMAVASFLEKHPRIARVNYNGLTGHPDHVLAKKQMRDFGGMLSFEVKGGLEAAARFMDKLRFCLMAPTLGDVETLAVHPASMSHRALSPAVREANGIPDGLIRLSVGIEDVEDILEDLVQAL